MNMKILIAVDGSPHTQRMLAYLVKHKTLWGSAEFAVVHCVPAVPPGAANMLSKEDLRTYYADEAERVFVPVREFLEREGFKATFVTETGSVADRIAKLSEAGGFDLLVMGSHGHGAFGKLMLGSVATKVMAQCGTPVLLVR